MSIPQPVMASPELWRAIEEAHRADEATAVTALLDDAAPPPATRQQTADLAARLVEGVRAAKNGHGGLDAFLQEYGLSSREGVVLMCVAEALLRIPDPETADRLLRDKLGEADWQRHLGRSPSLWVNASTWALMLTGRIVRLDNDDPPDVGKVMRRLVARSGEPLIRQAMVRAMRLMGRQFVMGRTIDEALKRTGEEDHRRYRHSYDMLGEAAMTAADAARYFDDYAGAIEAVGRAADGLGPVAGPGVSVKLSALHPRFETAQRDAVMAELVPCLIDLCRRAMAHDIGLCIDAEESQRLMLSLDVLAVVCADDRLGGWRGLGLAVQAYQKRAPAVIDWLADLARRHRRRLMVRLVKGAYWDTEVKRAQELGLRGYPVYTRKVHTDVSYLACARRLLTCSDAFFPQFATHNAHTLAAVRAMADEAGVGAYEFQRLHGMGEALYDQLVGDGGLDVPCRVYAPVGGHAELLAYLVRRLLENGANSSFVNRLHDATLPVETLIAEPASAVPRPPAPHPGIPLPRDLFGAERANARGIDLADPADLRDTLDAVSAVTGPWSAAPQGMTAGAERPITSPADRRRIVGTVIEAGTEAIEAALAEATGAASAWDATPAADRAACLERAADLLEKRLPTLMALALREAGKTLPDAVAEVREAVDFCRYYALQARRRFAEPEVMPGPTGERNTLSLHGRGVFACISPWNFPLAIFTGQVTAALAAGNTVIAKPADQTPLVAAQVVTALYEAGVPRAALHLLPGSGATVGAALVADPRVCGVAFTGSVETGQAINRALAARQGPIVPLIAETGGQNAMIVDSSALPEQVVADVVTSAFRSAGQRCSALRVLFVQRDAAPRIKQMLCGAVALLRVGDPARIETDVGPVIDAEARDRLQVHADRMEREGRLLCAAEIDPATAMAGTFFAPRAYEIDSLDQLDGEVFGPILHVIEWAADDLDGIIDAINRTGFGLTFGLHSRVDSLAHDIHSRVRAGNTYVNRNMIGAVVGSQPLGGEGLSGTGPKAGGPHYLPRFAVERSLSVNTAAAGGNATLLSLGDED